MIDKLTAVIADVDGTINFKGSALMPHTRACINALHERGVLFGTASGRPLDHRSLDKAHEWGLDFEFDLAIGMNGGDLWDKDHEGIEHIMLLGREYIGEICEFMWPLDCNVIVYENAYDHVLVKRLDQHLKDSVIRNKSVWELSTPDVMAQKDTGKIEVQYDPRLDDEIMAVVNAHPSPNWSSVRTFPGTVEFVKPGLNKGVALRRYSERNGIPLDQIMTFGDMDNDIELIRDAGWGVCMANGCDAAKAVADAITEYGVHEDGMGRYLKTYVLA
ncbi:MAG: HAD family hydrolase [Atopobiaceae bacterium]|jgi:Cof subfamily protein (haloacid dehalogenase superfamily)|nr:HAD family hydrolase [Atopobiaceae bacterium]